VIVARQFIAWKCVKKGIRPVGHGVIGFPIGFFARGAANERRDAVHTVPYGTGPLSDIFQAFHAWLPSFNPFGITSGRLSSQHPPKPWIVDLSVVSTVDRQLHHPNFIDGKRFYRGAQFGSFLLTQIGSNRLDQE
jgi:hypothetical protein